MWLNCISARKPVSSGSVAVAPEGGLPVEPSLIVADAASTPATPFVIPGATGEFKIQILNEETARGVVTTIVHMPAGSKIPAHTHSKGAEMHYVLEGDLIENGKALAPGAFLTQAAGQVHGPHESKTGAKVLTVQLWQSEGGSFDFEPA